MASNVLSFAAEIMNPSKRERECFQASLDTYQEAVSWLVPIANQHWDEIQQGKKSTDKRGILERLVHKTKNNPTPPHAEFDTLYPNMPSYYRRAALTAAIGDVSSWRSNRQNWIDNGRQGDEPQLGKKYHQTPAFYKTNMWKTVTIGYQEKPEERLHDKHLTPEEQNAKAKARQERKAEATQKLKAQGERRDRYAKYHKPHNPNKAKGEDKSKDEQIEVPTPKQRNWGQESDEDFTRCLIKVRDKGDWSWVIVHLRPDQAWKLKQMSGLMDRSAPVLERRGRKWLLRFTFTNETQLTGAPVNEQRVVAVDLGVNTPATCCVMDSDGTVAARRFLGFPVEKGHLEHSVNRIRKAQSKGSRCVRRKWSRVNHLNEEISRKTARAIVDLAVEFSCTHVVFEHLGSIGGRKRGSRKWRLHLWRARDVQKRVERHAHLWGVRVARVCAWGTSRLAFDGSGRVKRGREIAPRSGHSFSYGWVEFSSGKLYAADLNAAYNIGARFFIRGFLKALPAKVRSAVLAKVPCCMKRSSCVLADLISLVKAIGEETASVVEAPSC